MEPYEIADLNVTLMPHKLGTQYVVVTFNSREVMDINGVNSIVVMLQEEFDQDKEGKVPKKRITDKIKDSQMSMDGGAPRGSTPGNTSQHVSQASIHDNKGTLSGKSSHTDKHSREGMMSRDRKSASEVRSFEN